MSKKLQRYGRTANLTISELFESVRFKIALKLFDEDPQLLKAILTELLLETTNVVRSTMVKTYSQSSSLPAYAMIGLLRSVNEFNTFNIFWSLTDFELAYYKEDSKLQYTEQERKELFQKIKARFMTNPEDTSV